MTSRSDGAAAHKRLKNETWLAVGQLPFARCFLRETGQGIVGARRRQMVIEGELETVHIGGQSMRFGIVGGADLEAFIAPFGRHIELECKTGKGRLSDKQRKFARAVEPFGVIFRVVRSAEEAVRIVTEQHEKDKALLARIRAA